MPAGQLRSPVDLAFFLVGSRRIHIGIGEQ
jgi:hypothetical protein